LVITNYNFIKERKEKKVSKVGGLNLQTVYYMKAKILWITENIVNSQVFN